MSRRGNRSGGTSERAGLRCTSRDEIVLIKNRSRAGHVFSCLLTYKDFGERFDDIVLRNRPNQTSQGVPRVRKLHEVAQRADVSVSTVSRVLNVPDKVSAGTRLRVERAIEEMGYRPSRVARRLRLRRGRESRARPARSRARCGRPLFP